VNDAVDNEQLDPMRFQLPRQCIKERHPV